jgi:hypothetical protein
MAVITRKKRCPSCGDNDFSRKHRSLWMRWFNGSRLYQCRRCRQRILLLNEHNSSGDGEYPDTEFEDDIDRD